MCLFFSKNSATLIDFCFLASSSAMGASIEFSLWAEKSI
jgi:hypothetical protein